MKIRAAEGVFKMPHPKTGFSPMLVAEALGVAYPTLNRWIKPLNANIGGTGIVDLATRGPRYSRRRLSLFDLATVAVVTELRHSGVPLQAIRAAFDTLRRDHPGTFDAIKEGTITGDRRVSLKAMRTRRGRWDVEVFDSDEKTLKSLRTGAVKGVLICDVFKATMDLREELETIFNEKEASRLHGKRKEHRIGKEFSVVWKEAANMESVA